MAGLARCDLALCHADEARAGLQRALDIFLRIGAAEAVVIAIELRTDHPIDDDHPEDGQATAP